MRVNRLGSREKLEAIIDRAGPLYIAVFIPCSEGIFSNRVRINIKPTLIRSSGNEEFKLGNSRKEISSVKIFSYTEVFHTTLEEATEYYNQQVLDYVELHEKALETFQSKYLIKTQKETL